MCHWERNRNGRDAIIVNIIDEASRFHVALVLKEGDELGNLTAMDYIEAVCTHEFREWCAARVKEVHMAADEAHWQIGIVETHIQLLKNQLSLMEDECPEPSLNTVWLPS